jgi:hypothetical protein
MNKTLIFLTSLLYSVYALACEVHLPHHLLILDESADVTQSFAHTGCSSDTVSEISSTLTSMEGKITSFQLSEMLTARGIEANIQPQRIEVNQVKNLLREQLLLPSGVQLKSSKVINGPSFVALSPGDRIEVTCSGCMFSSQQPININVNGFDGTGRTLTVLADFKKMVKAYKIIGFTPAFSEIKPDQLKEEYVESIPHTDLLTDLDKLHFFRTNKPLKAGQHLKHADLNPVNLVRAGLRTEVIIENSLVRLKTTGISRSNGTFGQLVEVFHPEKNKKYQGKVIDINKVQVEL